MGVEGIENLPREDPPNIPLPDHQVIEREEGEVEIREIRDVPEEVEEATPPNPGGGNSEE